MLVLRIQASVAGVWKGRGPKNTLSLGCFPEIPVKPIRTVKVTPVLEACIR